MRNPFKPTAGATPPLLVGRDEVLEEIEESIDDGPGAPARWATFTGARGVGKTVLLTEVAHRARAHGWTTLSETATPGVSARISAALASALTERGQAVQPESATSLRERFVTLLDLLDEDEVGLMITVDEVHNAAREDLREITATFQHLVTERRNVAMVLAGLPSSLSDLLNDDVLTFLRRATPFTLSDVALPAVQGAFLETITTAGRRITEPALASITEATGGYPFMIQLVGYHVWRKATGDLIDEEAAALGIPAARKRLGSMVHATALADLSNVDRTYLVAMAQDDGPSKTSDIAARLGESMGYASVYRTRLLAAGVIRPAGYGRVDFALPYLREYLRDHAVHEEMTNRVLDE